MTHCHIKSHFEVVIMTRSHVEYEEVRESMTDGTTQTFFVVKLWRQNVLVLTPGELTRALKRGRWYRRRQTERARAVREG